MYTIATGRFHNQPRQPQDAVIMLNFSSLPTATSIHSLPIVVNTLLWSVVTSIFSIVFLILIMATEVKLSRSKFIQPCIIQGAACTSNMQIQKNETKLKVLSRHHFEPLVGFEPTTPRLQITCSGQLS